MSHEQQINHSILALNPDHDPNPNRGILNGIFTTTRMGQFNECAINYLGVGLRSSSVSSDVNKTVPVMGN